MTSVPSKRRRLGLVRLLIPLVLVGIPVLAWLFVPSALVRGLVTGLVVGPVIFGAVFFLFVSRMRKRREAQLSPPPLPHGRWDFEMSGRTLEGEPVDFTGYSGRVLILNFWATWCAPCVAEMPSLARLSEATSDLDVALLCVTKEPAEVVRKFLKRHPLDVPICLLEGDVPKRFESRAIPATFVLDKTGVVALQHRGAAAWDDPTFVTFVRGLAADPK